MVWQFKNLIAIMLILLFSSAVQAEDENDDPYNPFVDYSESFDNPEEEADIYFLKKGRYISLAGSLGIRGFTGNLSRYFKPALSYGLSISYFFDLRIAVYAGFNTGRHQFTVKSASGDKALTSTVDTNDIFMGFKYYFNTQNLNKQISLLNPHIMAGFTSIGRTAQSAQTLISKDTSSGGYVGAGIEMNLGKKGLFVALHGTYKLVNFPNESSTIPIGEDARSKHTASGDIIEGYLLMGINF